MRLFTAVIAISFCVLSGCAKNSALIKAKPSTQRDVFTQVAGSEPLPRGFCDLRVTGSLKTHNAGIYSPDDSHGTPGYQLLLNVDGQAVLLDGKLVSENSEPMHLNDPETGEGMRYVFSSTFRLKPGRHHLVVVLPEDGVTQEREIDLPEGRHALELVPLYRVTAGRKRMGFTTSFKEGISSLHLILDGKEI